MRAVLAILLVFLGYGWEVKGQDLTGQWTGEATDAASGTIQKLVLSITEGDSSFGGVLHWYSPETQTIRHILVSGRFFGRDSILTIREDSSAGAAASGGAVGAGAVGGDGGAPGVVGGGSIGAGAAQGPPGGFYILFYRRTAGRRDMLEGHWHTATGRTGNAAELTIRLEKKSPPFIPLPVFKPIIHKKKDSTDASRYPILQGRESVVVAHIPVKGTDTIRVELYDNGEIDGDSVSLFVNGDLLVQHIRLAAQPKILLIPIDKSLPVNSLLLVAENLGRLPPNTALMVVTVHGKSYNLFLSTDYKKNASVEFSLQE
jgi:hypothetical protein